MAEPQSERYQEVEIGGVVVLVAMIAIVGSLAMLYTYLDARHTEHMTDRGFCWQEAKDPRLGGYWVPCPPRDDVPAKPFPYSYDIGKP